MESDSETMEASDIDDSDAMIRNIQFSPPGILKLQVG
jgi:hypothetical protein